MKEQQQCGSEEVGRMKVGSSPMFTFFLYCRSKMLKAFFLYCRSKMLKGKVNKRKLKTNVWVVCV